MSNSEFDAIKARLDEIADEVSQEGVDLDDALELYEEAVRLSLQACDVSESDLGLENDVQDEAPGESSGDSVAEGDAPASTEEVQVESVSQAEAPTQPGEA